MTHTEQTTRRNNRAKFLVAAALTGTLAGCGSLAIPTTNLANSPDGEQVTGDVPQTVAARLSGNTYIPTDPLSVHGTAAAKCKPAGGMLSMLPDNAVRIAIRDLSGDGKVSMLGNSVGIAGRSYRVIIDYINVDSANESMGMAKYTLDPTGAVKWLPLFQATEEPVFYAINRDSYRDGLMRVLEDECLASPGTPGCGGVTPNVVRPLYEEEVNVPVYIGVGIRITVNLTVRSGEIDLAGLGAIAAAAKLKQVSGDLVIQTLGITGSKVTTSLPLPSELTPETIQNAIMSMATIKSALYSTSGDVIVTPRIVGFYDPIGAGQQQYINAVVTQLAKEPVNWEPAC